MRYLAVLLLCGLMPPALAMPPDVTRDLLARTGFTPSPAEVAQWSKLNAAEAVQRWVAEAAAAPLPRPPDWVHELPPESSPKKMSPEQRRIFYASQKARTLELRAWWLRRMVATPTPLTERMTLFWHGLFATSLRKVNHQNLIYRQHELFRRQALGNYRTLLHAIARDPAMLWYLDGRGSRKQAPNENFARELLELFTLGEGHYSEQDIKEAARAFTGWVLDGEDEAQFRPERHDDGEKHFLGENGNFDGDAIIDIVLRQPRAAEFIVGRLWMEFISPEPDAAVVQRLAQAFRRDYEIAPLLQALFQEPAFSAAASRGRLIKSPVELVVGSLRMLGLQPDEDAAMVSACGTMGQALFDPPNVKGWPGGDAWINSSTLLARRRYVERLAGDEAAAAAERERLRRFSQFAESLDPASAQQLVLALPPVETVEEGATPIQRLRAWMLDPAYQLR